jgi:hypothetical protein
MSGATVHLAAVVGGSAVEARMAGSLNRELGGGLRLNGGFSDVCNQRRAVGFQRFTTKISMWKRMALFCPGGTLDHDASALGDGPYPGRMALSRSRGCIGRTSGKSESLKAVRSLASSMSSK